MGTLEHKWPLSHRFVNLWDWTKCSKKDCPQIKGNRDTYPQIGWWTEERKRRGTNLGFLETWPTASSQKFWHKKVLLWHYQKENHPLQVIVQKFLGFFGCFLYGCPFCYRDPSETTENVTISNWMIYTWLKVWTDWIGRQCRLKIRTSSQ